MFIDFWTNLNRLTKGLHVLSGLQFLTTSSMKVT